MPTKKSNLQERSSRTEPFHNEFADEVILRRFLTA